MKPPTLCKFIAKHPRLKEVIDEVTDEIVDLATGKLIENIRAGDMGAIKYYLDNKGQNAGFGQRKMAFKDGDGTVIVPGVLITQGKMSEEEWQRRFGPDSQTSAT